MMFRKKHELKTDSDMFQLVWDRVKGYEIRLDDREFAVGDTLVLRETIHSGDTMYFGVPLLYTGREVTATVTHVLCARYGLADRWVILSMGNIKTGEGEK